MRGRGGPGARTIAALSLAAALTIPVAAPVPAGAQEALIGVSCGGGFFVRMRTGTVFWVHGEPQERTTVYQGRDPLLAVSPCGSGVIAAFGAEDEGEPKRVFYSPNCRDIGAETGDTRLVHEGTERITRLGVEGEDLVIGFAGGAASEPIRCTAEDAAR